MQYSVYILYSVSCDVYYKGFSVDVEKRLQDHLLGKSKFTSRVRDWVLLYQKTFDSKTAALIEERRLKKLNRTSIEKIISG